MAKRKGSSGSGVDQYSVTQANLDRKGKTNKKIKLNSKAKSSLTPRGIEIINAAAVFTKAHPAGSSNRKRYKGI